MKDYVMALAEGEPFLPISAHQTDHLRQCLADIQRGNCKSRTGQCTPWQMIERLKIELLIRELKL